LGEKTSEADPNQKVGSFQYSSMLLAVLIIPVPIVIAQVALKHTPLGQNTTARTIWYLLFPSMKVVPLESNSSRRNPLTLVFI
jgi:hypothetical protein